MPGMYNGGAVYNHELYRLMDKPTDGLQAILDDWAKKTLAQKIWAHCTLLTDWELKLKAAKDLIAARKDPNSEVAKNISLKIAGWRAERSEPVAA